jgi:hypothetical protein
MCADRDVNTVKCPLCHVDVPIDKIDLPNRCLHPQCPLNAAKTKCTSVMIASPERPDSHHSQQR